MYQAWHRKDKGPDDADTIETVREIFMRRGPPLPLQPLVENPCEGTGDPADGALTRSAG